MGGIGSGSRIGHGKDTTSAYLRLDIRYLQRQGLLRPGTSTSIFWSRCGKRVASVRVMAESHCVRLYYRHGKYGEEWKDKDYPVVIEWTPCNFGGQRAWFRCPGTKCGRRVAIIYGDGLFLCRRCHNLNYESQHEHAWERALRRFQEIREKLGAAPGLGPFPAKPKGMHLRTYDRLRRQAGQAGAGTWPRWIQRLGTR